MFRDYDSDAFISTNSIEDGIDLFSEEDSFSFLEELLEEDTERVLKEPDDL
ncbi:10441_t:CDS:2, partial [Scutellospora calospora]